MDGNGDFQAFSIQRFGENHPIETSICKWLVIWGSRVGILIIFMFQLMLSGQYKQSGLCMT